MGHTMTEEVMIRSSRYIAPKFKRAIYFLKDLLLFIFIGMGALLYYIFIFIIFSIIEMTEYFSSFFIKTTQVDAITDTMRSSADNLFGSQGREFREYFIGR